MQFAYLLWDIIELEKKYCFMFGYRNYYPLTNVIVRDGY